MPEGSFRGRVPPPLTPGEIARNAAVLEDVGSALARVRVQRKYGDYGEAEDRGEGDLPVVVRPMGAPRGDDAHPGIERFASWHGAAAAGWVLD